MRTRGRLTASASVVAVASAALTASAHHSVLGFDGHSPVTISGRVAGVLWQNPHAYVRLDVADGAGSGTVRWTIEAEAAGVLRRLGWQADLLAPGTSVTSTGAPARDGRPLMRCAFLELPSGRRLPCHPGRTTE